MCLLPSAERRIKFSSLHAVASGAPLRCATGLAGACFASRFLTCNPVFESLHSLAMFTGIVERTVRVVGVVAGPKFRRLTLAVDWPDVRDGESVAVNGVCLSIAERSPGELMFDVIKETLDHTNLGRLQAGDDVHVERSLRVGDRIDGHFVQGHVDGVAPLLEVNTTADEWRLTLESPAHLSKYLI